MTENDCTRIRADRAAERLEKSGLVPSVVGDVIYVDGDCSHCRSRFKVGELRVRDGSVSIDEVDRIIDNWRNRP